MQGIEGYQMDGGEGTELEGAFTEKKNKHVVLNLSWKNSLGLFLLIKKNWG